MQGDLSRIGQCLCGAVTVTTSFENQSLGACHCAKCRKWSGGAFMELECGSNVIFEGMENIAVFNSSDWAERGFCKVCGSHLFMKPKNSNEYGVSVGLFENDEDIKFDRQVFYDKKPSYYSFSNETKNISSEYIYEQFPQCRSGDT
ncbi:MAG: aldehyde-activating protein [SAR86 cluster bacterium]|uniref:Aldehyde-activating protein n=1 Tax=SAR86 cluster bacterium TaxID=2030880 RepID=A0A2A4WVR0_9GAMM|nr:MAG: aldehyde-activating protein [SAR86 cluster bacterium]